jgi:signal transduction histidine kinase
VSVLSDFGGPPRGLLLRALFVRVRLLLRGRPVALDLVLAAATYAAMMLVAAFAPVNSHWHLTPDLAVLAAVTCGASLLRRRFPVSALILAAAPIALCPVLGINHNLLPLAVILPLINVFLRANRQVAMTVAAFCVVALTGAAVASALANRVHTENTPPGFAVLVLGVVCIAIGEARRSRRDYVRAVEERALRAEHGREEEARRRVAEERLRISRDLHDILAHHIALITVQAGAAAHVLDRQPDLAREALEHIREAGSQALTDLHETITVLRGAEERGESSSTEPTAGLERLDELIESFVQAGLQVQTKVRGEPRRLPATADVTAYRVIQESLTNVRKHAGAVPAWVVLDYRPRSIEVRVDNARFPSVPRARGPIAGSKPGVGRKPGVGHGLLGMRERTQTLGGSLEAGPLPGGGFRVSACIPCGAGSAGRVGDVGRVGSVGGTGGAGGAGGIEDAGGVGGVGRAGGAA